MLHRDRVPGRRKLRQRGRRPDNRHDDGVRRGPVHGHQESQEGAQLLPFRPQNKLIGFGLFSPAVLRDPRRQALGRHRIVGGERR